MKLTSKEFRQLFVKKTSSSSLVKQKTTEDQEQRILCSWLKERHPLVIYTLDLGGIRLTKRQRAIMLTRAKRGHPDLIIQEWYKDTFCGLALEFKRTGETIKNKAGKLKNNHLLEQNKYLIDLEDRGYFACFAIGIESAKAVISAYLQGEDLSRFYTLIK